MSDSLHSRRSFVKKASTIGVGCLLAGAMTGCTVEPEKVMGTLSELKTQGYLTVRFNSSKAHARFIDDELVIFSQICRHKKCTVHWEEEENSFYCPCHEGTYDAEGNVTSGPPEAPLRRFQHEMRGDTIVVLNEYLKG